jgi:hypothetical protein
MKVRNQASASGWKFIWKPEKSPQTGKLLCYNLKSLHTTSIQLHKEIIYLSNKYLSDTINKCYHLHLFTVGERLLDK